MIRGFVSRLFPAHQWVESNDRRTCSVCERVEELNEVMGVSWDVILKGVSAKHRLPVRPVLAPDAAAASQISQP